MESLQFDWKRNWWVVLALMLASVHCAQCIFFDNYSFIDLVKYENGQAAMPFQGRIAMVPLLHAVHNSPLLKHLGMDLSQTQGASIHYTVEVYSPEKLASYVAGVISIFWMVWMTALYALKRYPQIWWFTPALFLAILYASYGARADQNLWYPYDLPHAALFTTALLALLSGNRWLLTIIFVLDCPMRETSVYVLPCILAVGYVRKQLKPYAWLTAALFAFWLVTHLWITHHFRANPSDVGLRYHQDFHAFSQPKHLPQVASAIGFMAFPILVFWRKLPRLELAVLIGAIPGVVLSGILGIWYETRVWSEWNAIAACLVTSIFVRYLENLRPALHSPENT
jgi:hypothetical protein